MFKLQKTKGILENFSITIIMYDNSSQQGSDNSHAKILLNTPNKINKNPIPKIKGNTGIINILVKITTKDT